MGTNEKLFVSVLNRMRDSLRNLLSLVGILLVSSGFELFDACIGILRMCTRNNSECCLSSSTVF